MTELAAKLGRPATLDDVADAELDRLAELGFDWIWLLSVWQTGDAGREVSRGNAELRKEFEETLPDLREQDICGSGFAIAAYTVDRRLGGDEALARLRERLRQRGLRLMLDFVPNHTALDHLWVETHPEFYIAGTQDDLAREPQNYVRVKREQGDLLLAHGRDPYFPGWADTLQLNYGSPALQQTMIGELCRIAGQCDGVRCDMAMLLLPDIFERTWGVHCEPFWPRAIEQVRRLFPQFCLMAEVYWDLEWTLQRRGFDYTYDKRLYDRLRDGQAQAVREHFLADLDYQNRLSRFLENHDEPQAAATFPPDVHQAAAVITFLAPGLRFFHDGQLEGRRKRISPHLCRRPDEPVDARLEAFYSRLLSVLRNKIVREGQWRLLECQPAWEGNWTADCFIAFGWQDNSDEWLLTAVNYAANQSQCYVRLPFESLASGQWRLDDLLGDARYVRNGQELLSKGLYLDVAPWQRHVFSVRRL